MAFGQVEGGLAPPQYPIESVDNALKVLLLLGEQESIRLTDVSTYLGVASSTAHRLLAMLQYRGFVRQNRQTKAYEPGPALSSIAFALMRQVDVRERARPAIARLSAAVGETVHLGRLDGASVFFVDSIESPRAVRVGSRLGLIMPAHCTSTGKALLASLSLEEVRTLYPQQRLAGMTEHSISSRKELEEALSAVRERGYATSREESEEGVASLAAFLGDFSGARYALNVSAPTTRISDGNQQDIANELLAAAAEIQSFFL